jgi:hypothetical protein
MQNWHLLYNTTTGQSVSIGTVIADPLPEGITALPLTDAEGEGLQNGTLKWDAATRSLIPTPPPAVTAAEWVGQHLTPLQILSLQRLEMALLTAIKPLGSNMAGLKGWLEGMMLASVDPTPRTFDLPPCSYEQASAEAVAALQS